MKFSNRGSLFRPITTVTDTAVTPPRNSPLPMRFLLIGTGINCTVRLDDARLFAVGDHIEIVNSSSEYVIVENQHVLVPFAAPTLWVPLGPGDAVRCICTNNATFQGAWIAQTLLDRPEIVDHFNCQVSSSVFGWSTAVSGAGATVGTSTVAAPDCFGYLRLYGGTDAAGRAHLYAGLNQTYGPVGVGTLFLDSLIKIAQAVPTPTEDYIVQAGFGDDLAAAAHADGVWFDLDRTNPNANNWYLAVNRSGGAVSKQDTTIAATTTMQRQTLIMASGAARVDGWLDRQWIGSITGGQVPAASTERFGKNYRVIGVATAGGTSKQLLLCRVTEKFVGINGDI